MSCGSCGKSFGWFSKEIGCVKCNRIFCSKCLIHKIQSEDKKQTFLVCLRCHSLNSEQHDLSRNKKSSQKIEELLEVKPNEFTEPVLEPTLNITTASEDLRARPNILKENNADDEIHQRLANLKGLNLEREKNTTFTPDTRSDQEKIEDLLKQFVEEKDINDQHDTAIPIPCSSGSIDDIERRLAALRGLDLSKIKAPLEEFVEESEGEEIDRTVLKFIEEAKLPDFGVDSDEQELISSLPQPPGIDKKDLEELPFCEICNEDAVIRCLECENIFCHKCFLEFHDEEDYKTHKTKPYEAPKAQED